MNQIVQSGHAGHSTSHVSSYLQIRRDFKIGASTDVDRQSRLRFPSRMESKMCLVIALAAALLASAQSSYVRELRVFTADCTQCGMTALGEISVKVYFIKTFFWKPD